MSLFAGDAIIKCAIELAIEDLRKNEWVISDIFSTFMTNPYLKNKYGAKEVSRAKEFILNNKIEFYLRQRIDNMNFPCVTIALSSSTEDKSLATLADQDMCIDELDSCEIKKPIPFVVKPTQFLSYNKETGEMTFPENTEGLEYAHIGTLVIDPSTGAGFVVKNVSTNSIFIEEGTDIKFQEAAIVPQYPFYKARRERIISQESYTIGLHVHGDTATLTFLYGLVKYALLRYREGLLEYNNFQLSNISSSDIIKNDSFGEADNVFSRYITLTGQCEESWVKTPERVVEFIEFNNEYLNSGIKVCSNLDTNPNSEEADNKLWITIDDLE